MSRPSAPHRRAAIAPLAAVLALGVSLVATPVVAATPAPPRAVAPQAPAAAEPFRLNLFREGDFVTQTNTVQCVGASMQMMLNMMRPVDDGSAAWQLELQTLARRWSPRFANGTDANGQVRERRGASSRGWAFGLTRLGYGPYRVTSASTLADAVDRAATAIRRTGRPAGLLVWHGAHAWVMSGFEATGDPLAAAGDARLTHVFVQDPLYPRGSSIWGPSAPPNSRLSLEQLAADFLPWRPRRASGMSGRFVVVLPEPDPPPFARALSNPD